VATRLLLTGRAGSGKTRAVLDRLHRFAEAGRLDEVLLLLPTQSQVDHLRSVVVREAGKALRDDFAHTFFTLCRSWSGVLPERLVSAEGKDYLIGELLRLEPLAAFATVRDTRGFRQLLGDAIQELKQNGITPEEYPRRILAPLQDGRGGRQRHKDLGKALQAYQARLRSVGRLDQEDLEQLALRRLVSETGPPAGKKILLVDGFHDFTTAQLHILEALARRIPESLLTLGFDAASLDSPLFRVSAATRRELLSLGFAEERLQGNRRTFDPTLRRLEEALFEKREAPPAEAGEALQILRAARRDEEVEGIARRIVCLVREKGVPYRDIAVLYHDLAPIASILEGTFARFGIPLRIYQPRPLSRHPLAEFLLDLGQVLAEGPARETLLRLLHAGFIERLDPAEVDRLDHHLREHDPPASPAAWLERCGSMRLAGIESVLRALKKTGERCRGRHTHDFLCAAWIGCFEDLALPLGEQGTEGASDCAAYQKIQDLMESARLVHDQGKASITLGILVERIREGCAGATFRLPDRRREVVNAINAFDARQWEVPYLFVAGLLEREFPPAPREDLFFDDGERRALNASGLRFPDRDWRRWEERFLFYTALTRARGKLFLSHARWDAQGNPTLASFFLGEVERLFTPASLAEVTRERSPSEVLPPAEEMVALEDVDRAVCLGLEERYPAERMPHRIALAGALYQRRREDPRFLDQLRAASDPAPILTRRDVLEEIANRETAFSNSALRDFLQCPYLHFARKWMRLEPLPGALVTPLELGSVLHDTLREYLASGAQADPFRILDSQFERHTRGRAATFQRKSDSWRLQAALRRILEAEKGRVAHLRPSLFEIVFGLEKGEKRPGVPLRAGDREEILSGKIDRIDTDSAGKLGYVVDYKYSRAEWVKEQFKQSLEGEMTHFQLPIYLLALGASLGLEPAGAELLSVKNRVRRFAVVRGDLADLRGAEKQSRRLGEAEFEAYLQRAREVIARLIVAARRGTIATQPRDPQACGPGACVGADLCRYDRWLGGRTGGD
jgi:ATP-dependent helicase/nuclease subunit B